MSWELVTSQAIIIKAGTAANSTLIASGAFMTKVADLAQGRFVKDTRRDWTNGYSSLNAWIKIGIEDAVAAAGAKIIVETDMSGYPSRNYAETTLNVLDDDYLKGVQEFKTQQITKILTATE